MSVLESLTALLAIDPDDVGCEVTFRLVDVYVDLVVAGEDPDQHLPGISAHLATCGPCADDYEALLAAVRSGVAAGPADPAGPADLA